ncbi:putative NBD/HSP70 family sugar kinase [Diaminobutyricimonas aerilata]|uniref:Putative NBD/HSP70 family sugar kinase n=1 Tax=Diaminobutyricimonas aerilata TaxID=1162967 RepID=A0A2M9CGM9_9MICO|nr:ROK family protein [Diaminobutyricimonas aerilata]PJJ71081.1 putative NBD/HSP70 family sugar kinase [Diaminobutyricimonas aerilata]
MTAPSPSVRGLGNESVRRENLASVLRLVHRNRTSGRSRSELTALTGLNRSTIAALVGELASLGLVAESEPESRTRVGRPSPVVTTTDTVLGIAVNPEIDAISVAVVGLGARVLARTRVPASATTSAQDAVALTATAIERIWRPFAAQHRNIGVGVAVPGLVRADDGLVRLAPHFGWVDEPFTALLSERIGLPVAAANDATLGVLAESTFGAGRGEPDVVYLNGGASGIGGGIISGGAPLLGAAGYAGELGHTLVNSAGIRCHCGASGCLETEVRRAPLLELTGLTDAEAGDLEGALAASDDPAVRAEVERQLDALAVALRNAVNTLNPRLIVLGGFLSALYAVAPEQLDDQLARQPLAAAREGVRIARAELGGDILSIGAAELAFAGVLGDPAASL